MGKFRVIYAAMVIVGFAGVWQWQRWSMGKLRQENELLRATLEQSKQLDAGGTPAPVENSLTKDQLAELLKLRSEVTQLRGQTNQIATLNEANKKLVASIKELEKSPPNSPVKRRPEDALPEDIHPTASWAFRGYATPEAALESFFWAEANKDRDQGTKRRTVDFRITGRRQLSDDEMVLIFCTSWNDADGHIHFNDFVPTVFQRIGGEWKITDKHAP